MTNQTGPSQNPLEEQIASRSVVNVTPDGIRGSGGNELLALQRQLQLGDDWGIWTVPPNLLTPRDGRRPSTRSYRLALALPKGVPDDSEWGERVWIELLRVALASALFPCAQGIIVKHSTILTRLHLLGGVVRALPQAHALPEFWSRASSDDFLNRPGFEGGGLV